MQKKYFYDILEEYIYSNEIDECNNIGVNYFIDFCYKKYRYLKTEDTNNRITKEFLFVWLPMNINKINIKLLSNILESINNLCTYIQEIYNINIKYESENAENDLIRIYNVNQELNRFLENPVISYSPFIIDIEKYKKRKSKILSNNCFDSKEKGYYTVIDLFPNNSIILKKLYTGRFIKIILDKQVIKCIKPNDILYMSVKQSPFLSWEIEKVIRYYPEQASEYIFK